MRCIYTDLAIDRRRRLYTIVCTYSNTLVIHVRGETLRYHTWRLIFVNGILIEKELVDVLHNKGR